VDYSNGAARRNGCIVLYPYSYLAREQRSYEEFFQPHDRIETTKRGTTARNDADVAMKDAQHG